jgi:hypothetical protein
VAGWSIFFALLTALSMQRYRSQYARLVLE